MQDKRQDTEIEIYVINPSAIGKKLVGKWGFISYQQRGSTFKYNYLINSKGLFTKTTPDCSFLLDVVQDNGENIKEKFRANYLSNYQNLMKDTENLKSFIETGLDQEYNNVRKFFEK